MERNTVERAIKTERDAQSRTKRNGQAQLVYVKRHKLQHPHHVKVSPRGLLRRDWNTKTGQQHLWVKPR